jgi:hypothetical protein
MYYERNCSALNILKHIVKSSLQMTAIHQEPRIQY